MILSCFGQKRIPNHISSNNIGNYIPVDLNPAQVITNNLYFRHVQHYNIIDICFVYLLLSDSLLYKNWVNMYIVTPPWRKNSALKLVYGIE